MKESNPLALLIFSMIILPALAFGQMQVGPFTTDPNQTNLVGAQWVPGAGCPTASAIVFPSGSASDAACPTGDPTDPDNEGLLLVKSGPTANAVSAQADVHNVFGTVLTELGFDIRSGSHCAVSPRFVIVTSDSVTHVVNCASLAGTVLNASPGWRRLRIMDLTQASPAVSPGSMVINVSIVFDEGQDAGPDFSGQAVLDNIDINGILLGTGQGQSNPHQGDSPHQGNNSGQ